MRSAIFRKQRETELSAEAVKAVLQRFEYDCKERYEVLHVASFVCDEACSLLSRYGVFGLRTLDSLQFATFLTYCEKDRDHFVCGDKKLSAVGEQEGVKTVFV